MMIEHDRRKQGGTHPADGMTSGGGPSASPVTEHVAALLNQFLELNFQKEWSEETAADFSAVIAKLNGLFADNRTVHLPLDLHQRVASAVGFWLNHSDQLFDDFSNDLFSCAAIEFITFAGSLGVRDFADKLAGIAQVAQFKCSQLDGDLYRSSPQRGFVNSESFDWEPGVDCDTATMPPESGDEKGYMIFNPYEMTLQNRLNSFDESKAASDCEELERWVAIYGPLLTAVRQSHGTQSDAFADFWVETVRGMDYLAPEWPEAMRGLLTCPRGYVEPVLIDMIAASAEDGAISALLLTAMSARVVSTDGSIVDCTSMVIDLMSREFDHETRQSIMQHCEQILSDGLGEFFFDTFEVLASDKLSILQQLFPAE